MSLPGALERVGGIQAQYAPSMYVGLWSRVEGVAREAVTRALEDRSIVQGTLMRCTIHVVGRDDYWPVAQAVRAPRRIWFLRSRRGQVSAAEMAGAARRLRSRLSEGPVGAREADALLGRPHSAGVGLWVDLVRVPPSGTWERRRADLLGLAEDWLPSRRIGPVAAREHLVRAYLRAFGPAASRDVANWAGATVADLTPALRRLPLRHFRGPGGEDLIDLPGLPLPRGDTPAPVRFLPHWDAALLVHARRAGILPEEHRPRIFSSRNPHSTAVFLVDGAVAGAWAHRDGRIVLEPYAPLDAADRRALDREAERLAVFMR